MFCFIEGCERPVRYKGMCGMHYKRQWRHGDVNYCDCRTVPQNLEKCLAPDCDERGAWKGYCPIHYHRVYKYNRTHRVVGEYGKGTIDANGYRVIGGQYEHRMIAAKALGRSLPNGVVIHHMNGVKDDNHTPFNLVICPDQSYHMLLEYRAWLWERGKATTIKRDE